MNKKHQRIVWIILSIVVILSLIVFPLISLLNQNLVSQPVTTGK